MSTYRELIYIISDLAKTISDDSKITENHIAFLLDKYRMYLLRQKYDKDGTNKIPPSAFQTICIDLKKADFENNCNDNCLLSTVKETYLVSEKQIPTIYNPSLIRAAATNKFKGSIAMVSPERMSYVGYNNWLKNVIYGTIDYDNHLYLKSNNTSFLNLQKIYLSAIFEEPKEAFALKHCNNESCTNEQYNACCSYLDMEFPFESSLETQLIALVLKEILGAAYRPADIKNNAEDDLSSLASFIAQKMKKEPQTTTE